MGGTGLALILSVVYPLDKQTPKVAKEFAKTSVMILDNNKMSGGSGVILRSNMAVSEILTNKHVCRLTQGGGYVVRGETEYLVHSIKKYPDHDLCLVKVFGNLGVNTKVAALTPTTFQPAYISGHPALLPHVLTTGNFSGNQIINLVVGFKPCKKEEVGIYTEDEILYCIFFGGIPILQSFESQLVTGTILPGSSGSGVFNDKGEISGVVFAGKGRGLGYAFIVPHQYVVDFIETEKNYPYVSVVQIDYDKLLETIFDSQGKCEEGSDVRFQKYCKSREDYLIWRR
jgi:hypothetical protein